jgi:FtsP/CotA-like multicopper oxidase with cupredoxin domain
MAVPYTVGTGVPGPGQFSGGIVDWSQTSTVPENKTYETFGCKVVNGGDMPTPDWMTATVYFERKVFGNGEWTFPDGVKVKYWGFEDTLKAPGAQPYPSPIMRLRTGEIAHVRMETRKGPHTIHHHGMNPTTMNDGVGHVSFETSESYTYQFKPKYAGTYFYHCHVNTVLHFEMGLFGLMVIDPQEGWGVPYDGATKHRYDVEAFWVADDIDPRWHNELSANAGLCGDDVGLNIFRPRYFMISGVHNSQTATHPNVAVRAVKGQKILIRLLNASYSVLGVKINNIPCELISVDGHTLVSPDRPWAGAQVFPASTEFYVNTAVRHDLWIDTTNLSVGSYKVEFTYYDWITRQVHNASSSVYRGRAETFITVTSPSI